MKTTITVRVNEKNYLDARKQLIDDGNKKMTTFISGCLELYLSGILYFEDDILKTS